MESEVQFKVGDVVELKSGGPAMTVDSVSDHPTDPIRCVYFNSAKADFLEKSFFKETLRITDRLGM